MRRVSLEVLAVAFVFLLISVLGFGMDLTSAIFASLAFVMSYAAVRVFWILMAGDKK